MEKKDGNTLLITGLIIGGAMILFMLLRRGGDPVSAGFGQAPALNFGFGDIAAAGAADWSLPSPSQDCVKLCSPCSGKVTGAALAPLPPLTVQSYTPPAPMLAVMEFIEPAPPAFSASPSVNSCAWNAAGYADNNPDVAAQYPRFASGEGEWKKWRKKWGALSLDGYLRQHYDTWGKGEGRTWSCSGGSAGPGPAISAGPGPAILTGGDNSRYEAQYIWALDQ